MEQPNSSEELKEIFNTVKELWLSETAYVEDLQTVIDLYTSIPFNWNSFLSNNLSLSSRYLTPFRLKDLPIIKPTDIPKIFSNIETIFAIHQDLLEKEDFILEGLPLTEQTVLENLEKLCEVFKEVVPLMPPIYSAYSINLDSALNTIHQYSKLPAFIQYEDVKNTSYQFQTVSRFKKNLLVSKNKPVSSFSSF